ncbi:glycosyltransferase SypJ [Vibrio ponticus]|nr:glycosyltransferase SypJ [Vibrio ponticus]
MVQQHKIIFDPIPFKGGSKIATSEILALCDKQSTRFTVMTVDANFWQESELAKQHRVNIVRLYSLPWLSRQVHGLAFWLNQAYFAMMLLLCLLFRRQTHGFIAASGPGIDMPVYLVNILFNKPIVQLIHGNVAASAAIGWCLTRAHKVFYLPSTKQSLKLALARYLDKRYHVTDNEYVAETCLNSDRFASFVNGLSAANWPTQSQTSEGKFLWAASLLKWKGLERYITAVRLAQRHHPIKSNICYIEPKNIQLGISKAPVSLPLTNWFHDPYNFDQLRSDCSVFVSTSENEPFGLSILEALAAGMCVVIPQDNSYWDQTLVHGENCMKYTPKDESALYKTLLFLQLNPNERRAMQRHASHVAKRYCAEHCYQHIVESVSCAATTLSSDSSSLHNVKKSL